MRNFLKRKQRVSALDLFIKSNLFSELLSAIRYLNPTATDEEVLFMGTTTLLAITDTTAITKAVELATNEANNKAKEVSDLDVMFNAPTTTNNNN